MYSDLKSRIVPLLRELDDINSGHCKRILDIVDEYEERMRNAIEWTIADMVYMAISEGWELSDEDAQASLEEMINDHDCNNGITWTTVSYCINQYKN